MLISAQEQALCHTLRNFPQDFSNQYTDDARRLLQQVLFRALVGNNETYLRVLFQDKVPEEDHDWSLRVAQGSTDGAD